MTGMAYVKLFGSILTSTIWRESPQTRVLWITMLALADRDGVVEASVPGLADLARLSVEDCRRALEVLEGPDPDSRTQIRDGRRIQRVQGGWQVVNYEAYRDRQTAEDVREKARLRQQRKRQRDASRSSRSVTPSEAEEEVHTHTRVPRAALERPPAVPERTWEDWLRHRRQLRAPVTATVLAGFEREAAKAGVPLEVAIAHSVTQGWRGFRSEWLLQGGRNSKPAGAGEHIRNLPVGTPSCSCAACVQARAVSR
jgi:hypothetical protein